MQQLMQKQRGEVGKKEEEGEEKKKKSTKTAHLQKALGT